FYKAHKIADRFDLLGHDIVEAELRYPILNRDQQFEAVKPVSTKLIEASLINQAVRFNLKMLRDNVADREDQVGVHDHPINSSNRRKINRQWPLPGWSQFAFLGASLVDLVGMLDSIFELTIVALRK